MWCVWEGVLYCIYKDWCVRVRKGDGEEGGHREMELGDRKKSQYFFVCVFQKRDIEQWIKIHSFFFTKDVYRQEFKGWGVVGNYYWWLGGGGVCGNRNVGGVICVFAYSDYKLIQ